MVKTAIFASGSGTNAENIIQSLNGQLEVTAIYCNNPKAGVIERGKRLATEVVIFDRSLFYESDDIVDKIIQSGVEYIILAGFLWKIPQSLLEKYPGKIINIHPALLPKYGGKGMYGMNVHKAVIENKEQESGITIHLVNERYDEGRHLFQASCEIMTEDTPESLATKIHQLEYKHFPEQIMKYIEASRGGL